MKKLPITAASVLLGAIPATVLAQAADVRDIRPNVMLIVDTSSSMGYEMRSPSSSIAGRMAECDRGERSRWIGLVEVLTGSMREGEYRCDQVPRPPFFSADLGIRGYTRAWNQTGAGWALLSSTDVGQATDGILDTYLERVRFGLMVFDTVGGLYGTTRGIEITRESPALVADELFARAEEDSFGPYGDYSYGDRRVLSFPGCTTNYLVNAGVRNQDAAGTVRGGLLPLGVDTPANPNFFQSNNGSIQQSLRQIVPWGGSPIGAALEDYRWYLDNAPDVRPGGDDIFAACRDEYVILLSNGEPTDPYREMGCDTPGFRCPYERPRDTAERLCGGLDAEGRCASRNFSGLFTVLFAPGDEGSETTERARRALDEIAEAGGTERALLADDVDGLRARLSEILDRAAGGTRTRTSPSFAGAGSASQGQFEVTSGFLVGRETGSTRRPWSGVLNRQRWECDGRTPVRQPIAAIDRFADVVTAQATRRILTVAPALPNEATGIVRGQSATTASIAMTAPAAAGVTTAEVSTFANMATTTSALTPAHFGLSLSDTATRDRVIQWVRADAGSGRESAKLGDIYHSNPVIVGSPNADIPDESYNLFRRSPRITSRPSMLYVATNDGILHALFLQDHSTTEATYTAGQEAWGFVPPAVLRELPTGSVAHRFLLDGTPVVRDVFFSRRPGDAPNGDAYHTVLVMGMRQGGNAYIAMDVTNPLEPQFLWQWTHRDMGQTYGRPAIAQVRVDLGDGPEERAVAILPGGMGTRSTGTCTIPSAHVAPQGTNQSSAARTSGSCWTDTRGQSLHVIDLATGHALRSFPAGTGLDEVSQPIVGAVSAFTGQPGSIATRAYTTSADGVVWRLDLTSSNRTEWQFRPMHDIYWREPALSGHPSPEAPIISIDQENRPVVIVGTADPDNLETPGINYITSLTDTDARPILNWEIRLRENEMMTGGLELYDSRVYFSTFLSTGASDPCSFGTSRLWGVHFRDITSESIPTGYGAPSGRFPGFGWQADTATTESRAFTQHFTEAGANQVVMGVGITQRPTCVVGTTVSDPYIGPRFEAQQIGGGEFQLVAQVTSTGAGPGAGTVGTIVRALPAPLSYTRNASIAPQVDY